MSDEKKLLDIAIKNLEENRFAEAILCLREAALTELPSSKLLSLLRIAEDDERVLFRRKLSEKYPDSPDVRMAEISLIENRKTSRTLHLCSELLVTELTRPAELKLLV